MLKIGDDVVLVLEPDRKADDVGAGSVDAWQQGMGACVGCRFQQAQARSRHTQGVQVAMGDGSCRFIKESISVVVWRGLISRAGGEVISADSY